MTFALQAYRLTGTLASPWLRRMLAKRAVRGKEVPARISERFGIASLPRPPGKLVWIHAASVGETVSVLSVIEALAGRCEVLLTTGTVTSAQLAAERLPAHARHQFIPLDVPGWVERFLRHWHPQVAVFVESEIWPSLISKIDAHGIPRLLINASLSERSVVRWQKLKKFAGILLFGFRYIHVQSAADAANFTALGAAGILPWGNLKFAAPVLPYDHAELTALQRATPRHVWLAASTHEGEETMVMAAHNIMLAEFPDLVTIIVPRHPERAAQFSGLRRSRQDSPARGAVYFADTIGELGLFYRLCPLAFIGGSLVPVGGHNIAEAARLGVPVITGPYTKDIPELVERLRACGGIAEVTDTASLADAAATWLRDEGAARHAGEAARGAFVGLDDLPARLANLILEHSL
ncbi:MAG: 3-deoxy-D-manno-octulosonic acid transferase [Acidocella sp. 20-57-95]|nr:MAG: 3-deoxy-D-manno-octulosonic acid transferase [Acidocella sp. 20-57-95]OYV58283.1 MAG: 3-deoxy-D-manno-octulosonic acid transferase [Acidocella sp. 21-58-7]HQT63589.1 3-deoxy-D-manno-octulosonic acid transferase [Acidocella sp.]HQU05035.1 3-deoxy-D-manno-octulosonic acid transferase [Acidocella sp.]